MSLSVVVMGASGRMGTTIANLAKEQGMTLAAVLERPDKLDALAHWGCLAGTDPEVVYPQVPGAVVIDFTAPEASLANARCAVKNGNPIVIGTTGFTPDQKAELDAIAQNGRVFWSPNMSVGVNVLLELLPELVQMLGPDYDLEMVELHHNRKKDSPSGTALRLAESLASARDWELKDVACYHREGIIGERPKKEIGVQAIRGGDVVGVHTVYFMGPGERIEVTHHAHSRENFAQGALRAASWLPGQPGGKVYAMGDILVEVEIMSSIPAKDWKSVWGLLTSGIREHVRKNGFTDVVLGLSGGMDSALVAALAVDALGKGHVHGVMMPSPWSSEGSITDSEALAANLGMETFTVPISPMMDAFEKALAPAFAGRERDVTEENIQSRIRGVITMSFSNKFHWMLLATGNKSEVAAGYCTMYGDTCGGLAPIADLYKTEVYQLAQWFNEREGMCAIPQSIFDKAPSAELRPGQKDQDSLPEYDVLDSILHALIEESKRAEDIELPGVTPEDVNRVQALMRRSAFKRLQLPPLLPVGNHAFGVHVHM